MCIFTILMMCKIDTEVVGVNMTGLIKVIAGAALSGVAVGIFASRKVGKMMEGDRARISKKRVSVIEVPYKDGDPEELDIVVLKKARNKTNE